MSDNTNIKKKAVKGVAWSAIERFSVQGVQFIISIILARLLTPNDFGLVAIVLVFSTIFQAINESGFNTALVHKQDRDNLDFSTAFVTNLAIGIISYCILFFLAPLIAKFYENENLINVMRLCSLSLIINAFGLIPMAVFTIRVDFKTQARASFTAAVISGLAGIVSAYYIKNVYAIVIQYLAYNVVYVSLMWMFVKYSFNVRFSTERFKSLWNYAYKLILARLIYLIFDDIYSLAIGKLYTPAQLGFYNRANSFRQVSSKNIINIVQRVSVPLLCENQKDNSVMVRVHLKFMKATALMVFPIVTGLMVLSKPFITVLLGEKWLPTADLFLLVCPIEFFYLISTFNRNIYNATGRTDWALQSEIVKKTFFILIFLITLNSSLRVFLIGLIIISILEMLYDTYFAKKQIGVTLFQQIKALMPVVIASLVMGVLVSSVFLITANIYLQLLLGVLIGVLSYAIICFRFNISDFRMYAESYLKLKKR